MNWEAAPWWHAVVPADRPPTGVLVVEDDDEMRMLLEEVLALGGHRVRTAADATAGLAVLRQWLPDAVVLDVRLPDLNAPAFRAAQRTLPGAAGVPVVLLSALHAEELEGLARDLGAAAWLAKPFDLEELLGTVARLTGR
jgi:DNA-binding response OmpR family regulator